MHIFILLRQYLLTLDTIDILGSVYLNFCSNRVIFKVIDARLRILNIILLALNYE